MNYLRPNLSYVVLNPLYSGFGSFEKKVSTRAHVLQFGILCRIFSMKLPSFFSFSFFNGIVDALLIFLWQNSIQLPMWKHVKNVSLLQVGRSTTCTYWCHIWFHGKGQLISKANFEVFIWTKKRTKIFLYFFPSLVDGSC